MTITAKYPSRCASCGGSVTVGQRIEWSKGRPVRHTECTAKGSTGSVAATGRVRRQSITSQYCYYPCPVSGRKCCPANGPCHDCF